MSISFASKKAVAYTSAGTRIPGTIYSPKGNGPSPGVLLLHTARGLSLHERAIAARLARSGYTTLVIAYSRKTTGLVLKDEYELKRLQQIVTDGLRLLQQHPLTRADRTAVIGLSLGGYFARRLATGDRDVIPTAAIIYYGVYALPEPETAELSVPLLVLQGDDDSPDFVSNAKRAQELASRYKHAFELVLYPGAGHQFDLFEPAGTAAKDAWNRTLAFLSKHLAS